MIVYPPVLSAKGLGIQWRINSSKCRAIQKETRSRVLGAGRDGCIRHTHTV